MVEPDGREHHPVSFHVTEITEVDPSLPDPHQQIEQRHLCQECARQLDLPICGTGDCVR